MLLRILPGNVCLTTEFKSTDSSFVQRLGIIYILGERFALRAKPCSLTQAIAKGEEENLFSLPACESYFKTLLFRLK